jgi:hypothetical protein
MKALACCLNEKETLCCCVAEAAAEGLASLFAAEGLGSLYIGEGLGWLLGLLYRLVLKAGS